MLKSPAPQRDLPWAVVLVALGLLISCTLAFDGQGHWSIRWGARGEPENPGSLRLQLDVEDLGSGTADRKVDPRWLWTLSLKDREPRKPPSSAAPGQEPCPHLT